MMKSEERTLSERIAAAEQAAGRQAPRRLSPRSKALLSQLMDADDALAGKKHPALPCAVPVMPKSKPSR